MEKKFLGLLAVLLVIWGCSIKPTNNPVGKNGNLKPCPESPNCVSTFAHDTRHAMPPLHFYWDEKSKQAANH